MQAAAIAARHSVHLAADESAPTTAPADRQSRAVPPSVTAPHPPPGRVVATRSEFRVTFPPSNGPVLQHGVDGAAPTPELRGWSSPHGEPYRPLGKPDLSLKFSPRLADGSSLLQNAQRMRVFEGHHGAAGSSLKDKEVRDAIGTGAAGADIGTPPGKPALFDLFPFNIGNNRKRTLDERQVKFAYRLHDSVSNYSPEKLRSLHRRPPPVLSDDGETLLPPSPRRPDDDAYDMLKKALRECSSRLRLVRNGAELLSQLPPREQHALQALQDEYYRQRTMFVESRTARTVSSRLVARATSKASMASSLGDRSAPIIDAADPAEDHSQSEEEPLYLPYTTRELQRSPHRRLPTFNDFRVRVREEKLQTPMRPLRSSQEQLTTSPTRKRTGRPSRMSSVLVASRPPLTADSVSQSLSKRPSVQYNDGLHRASQSSVAPTDSAKGSSPSKGGQFSSPSPTKIHSVLRLQAVVDAIEDAKLQRSIMLAQSIEALNLDRRDCMALKFKCFRAEHHIDDDLSTMRAQSEQVRVHNVEQTIDGAHWYEEMLRKLLARDGGNNPPHPAELFMVAAICHLVNDGRDFTASMLFELIQCIHPDDFAAQEVHDMLMYLRGVLVVPIEEWEGFFREHRIPLPRSASERRETQSKSPRHRLGSKLRALAAINQLLVRSRSTSKG